MKVTVNSLFLHCDVRDLRLYDDGRGETVYRLDCTDTYNSMAASMSSLLRLMDNSPIWFVSARAVLIVTRGADSTFGLLSTLS